MDDIWFAPGLSKGDLDLCLQALALQSGPTAPLLAVASRDTTGPRLVLASRALFALFRVESGEALSQRLLSGRDPGARRLAVLQGSLPLDGAPRLERLRFSIGPGSEIITFLCRRVRAEDGGAFFVAAALGVRSGLMPPASEAAVTGPDVSEAATVEAPVAVSSVDSEPETRQLSPIALEPSVEQAPAASSPGPSLSSGPLDVPAIHAALRQRWPGRRTLRFLWQSDADCRCTQVSPPLAEIVGPGNADIVGASLLELAPRLDPSGRFETALRSQETWSGVDVAWPIDEAPAGVAVGLGAIPAYDAERSFAGYRGYGIVRLDELMAREPLHLSAGPTAATTDNVIAFPSKALSAEDQRVFVALGAQLRDKAGLADEERVAPEPAPPVVPEPLAVVSETSSLDHPAPIEAVAPIDAPASESRENDLGRNGLALLDRLALGLLVSRDTIPIFANRHFLDLTGFADVDALHAVGGMSHLFGGTPGNASGAEAVSVRTRDGSTTTATARVQRMEWDGLPATLLTLQTEARQTEARQTGGQQTGGQQTEGRLSEARPVVSTAAEPKTVREDDERRELRAILETATDGVVVMDSEGLVLSLNRAGEALFGRDRGEVSGKPFLELFAPHDRDLARDYLEGVKSDATRSLLNDGREFLVTAAQGGPIPVFMTLGRLGSARDATASGKPTRFCALFRDLTHWKKVEGELEEARRTAERASALKSDFLAKVSHEIRTPLNAIIGFSEVILEERFGPLGSERYKDYLRDIHGSGTHVMSLINDLLDLSKIEAGKMELSLQPVDINRIVSECVATMQPQASRERVIMRLALAPALPRVTADERSLRQIALNILSNAVKFNEPGGQVIVATQKTESGHVVLRVRDTGPGMSEADITTALEPFRQLPTARSSPSTPGGTGLGLPLTKALAEANEAALTIRSKIDQGTLVEVAFPPARVLAAG